MKRSPACLARAIHNATLPPGSLAIFWLGQAGFCFKTPGGTTILVDPYLSDCVERLAGFKRIMPSLLRPEEAEVDWVISTHSHPDHLDVDAVPVLARSPRTRFIGSPDCGPIYDELGIPPTRCATLRVGESVALGEAELTAVYADHGALTPDALGFILQAGDARVWIVGDTAYRPERWRDVFRQRVDIIIPPINGAFGNLNAAEAARLAHDARARVAIPCHFWMFVEHNGNPAEFLAACTERGSEVKPVLLAPGEMFVYEARFR
ncbi:MAG: MBL fold metallo-hydrolase [Anaerolineae bacterium]|nr:MBL fold metallo-hydrolase [Anaerolineae bacterium]